MKSQSISKEPKSPRIFYGWWILILGSVIQLVGSGILYHSFTIFFLPLKREFGVSSAAISFLYGAARLEGGFEGPFVGYLIDRFGARTLILIGGSLAGLGLIWASTAQSFTGFLLIYILVIAVGSNAGLYHPVSTAINTWFIRHRGIGFGIMTAAGNTGGMVMAPLLSYIILTSGWRNGTLFAGILILMVVVPAGLLIHRSPESRGLYPDGRPPEKADVGNPSPEESRFVPQADFSVKQALRTPIYWMLAAGITLRILVTVALAAHFIPILVWKGVSESSGAYLVSLMTFLGIFTTLAMGWLGDRLNKAFLCSAGVLPAILGTVGLVLSESKIVLYAFPVGLSIAMGTIALNWSLIGDFFGRRSYATLRGIMGVGYGLGTFVSPVFAGWVFDRTGSYAIVLTTFSIILLIAAIMFSFIYRRSSLYPSTSSTKTRKR
jgi:sugar phosphate permease